MNVLGDHLSRLFGMPLVLNEAAPRDVAMFLDPGRGSAGAIVMHPDGMPASYIAHRIVNQELRDRSGFESILRDRMSAGWRPSPSKEG